MVMVSMLFIAQFYLENTAQFKLDVNRVAKVSSLFVFLVGPLLTFMWAAPIDHGLVHHMSAGVVFAVILFLIGGLLGAAGGMCGDNKCSVLGAVC